MANVVSIRIEANGTAAIVGMNSVADAGKKMTTEVGASSDRLQQAFERLNIKSALNIDNERAKITAAFEQIKNSGVASGTEISRAHVAMREKLSALDAPLKSNTAGFGALGAAGMAAAAGISFTAVITDLHKAGLAAEKLRNSFEAATGGMLKGAAEQAFARGEANRLGLDLLSVSEGFVKLTANAKGTALEGEKTREIFTAVTGASRSLSLGAEETSGIIRALGQMMSKGTVQSEELKSQLGEHLPGSFQIAARSMGLTTAQFEKMLETGQVLSDDFLPKFAAELQKTFPPGEKAMAGMSAETMRLKTAWYELKTTVMANGGESMFTDSIRGMKGLVVEADTFYSRMSAAYGLLKDFARDPMNPDLGGKQPPKRYDPVTKSEMMLLNPGLSGDFSARTNSLFSAQVSPDFGSLAGREGIDFGASLTRDNPLTKEEAKQAAAKIKEAARQAAAYQAAEKKAAEAKAKEGEAFREARIAEGTRLIEVAEKDAEARAAAGEAFREARIAEGTRLIDAAEKAAEAKAKKVTADKHQYNSIMSAGNPLAQMAAARQEQMDAIATWDEQEIGMAEKKAAALLKIDQDYQDAKARLEERKVSALTNSLENSMGQISNMLMQGNKRQFEAGKELGKMMIAIDTARAASSAFRGGAEIGGPWGVALGVAAAAAAVAAGAMNMARLDSLQYQARALGGPVTGGTTYLVGERGPELFTPGASGQITSNDKLQNLSGGQSINTTHVWQISTGVSDTVRSEIARLMPLIETRTVGAVHRAINSGGQLSAAVGRM